MASQVQDRYLVGWRLGVVITCLFFGSFLIALDTTIINVAIPQISTDFRALDDVAWYGTAYLITLTAFQPVYGSMYTFFKTTNVYRASIIIFEVGSILCAAAPRSSVFIAGRAIAGLGASGILQGALSIIGQVVPLDKRPMYMGIVVSVFAITVCAGPPLGGAFTQHATWRWCFWINLPIGVVVLVALAIFLRVKGEVTEQRALTLREKLMRMDFAGCLTFLAAMCCILLALQWGGQTKPWNSATVIGLLIAGGVLAIIFVFTQHRLQDRALIPPRVFLQRSIWTGASVLFFLGAAIYANTFFLPFYFQAVHHVTPVDSGVDIIPYLLPQTVALVITGVAVKVWGYYVPYMVAGECIYLIGQGLLTQLKVDTSTVKWASYLVVAGIGNGMAMQLPYTAVQVALKDEDIPVGNAIFVLAYQLGGALAISISQTITITTILEQIASRLPNLSGQAVIKAGAAGLSMLASTPYEMFTLQEIWNEAIRRIMILVVACVGASIPFTLGMEWLNAKKIAQSKGEDISGSKTEEGTVLHETSIATKNESL